MINNWVDKHKATIKTLGGREGVGVLVSTFSIIRIKKEDSGSYNCNANQLPNNTIDVIVTCT